ncbi:MAG: hypothetical protein GY694_11130 [Gammaproteobacteria bacterium]|nr:hypothetical protein [Gammaproteobacteria bacterium]
MNAQLKRLQIVEKLRNLSSSQDTGTFFIKTADKHLAMLAFKEGKIISLNYSHRRALQALEQIVKIDSAECSFKSTIMDKVQSDIPSTREIIHQIETAGTANISEQSEQSEQIAPAEQPVVPQNFSEEELLSGIADILLDYIGPISAMICEDAVSDMGGISSLVDTEKLIKDLSSDISDTSQQHEFIAKALLFSKKFF